MNRDVQSLFVCTVASVLLSSVIGEIIAPTRALSALPSFLAFAVLSAICAPTLYVIAALVMHAVMRRRKDGIERAASLIAFLVTVAGNVVYAFHARTA
jgi:hypothetical protein